jgi:plasmid replication initiation protein
MGNDIEKIDIKNWVTKSNHLIESTYKLTLQEQRILLVLASKVQPSDDILKTYHFRTKDFIEIIGNKKGTGFYTYIKQIVNELQTKRLTIKKDGKEFNYNWVITSIYEDNKGYITLQFHPELKGFFLELKEKFTSYQLENVVRLNSVYSIRIYELLKQYERIRKRKLTLEDLRYFLGIEKDKYKQYGHLKSKVLLVAQKEINEKTDIQFTFSEIKTGRKVTGFEFGIKTYMEEEEEKHSIKPLTVDSLSSEEEMVKTQLESLGVPTDKIITILAECNEEQIRRNIDYALKRKSKIKHLSNYIIKAIKHDYANDNNNKTVRKEIIPSYMNEDPQQDSYSLEEKQALYYQKRGSQEAFESKVLKVKDIALMLAKLRSQEINGAFDLKQTEVEDMKDILLNDIIHRKDLGLDVQPIDEFIDPEIKEVYKTLLNELMVTS